MTTRDSRKSLLGTASAWLAVLLLTAGPVLATTVTFRQGENGYTGAKDTYIQQNPGSAGANNGALQTLGWDGDDPGATGYDVDALIRFDAIVGTGAGQIPPGSVITSATLEYTVSDTGDAGTFARSSWTGRTRHRGTPSAAPGASRGPNTDPPPAALPLRR